MYRMLDATVPALPADRPRYLMGVGRPQDLLEAIRRGIDLFDCVMPTRNGRNALAFTDDGPLRLRNLQYERDPRPLEADCPCPACRHSRGYLRHLFMADEMLGPMLVSIHNLTYYQRLLADARQAIARRSIRRVGRREAAPLGQLSACSTAARLSFVRVPLSLEAYHFKIRRCLAAARSAAGAPGSPESIGGST